MSDAPEAAAPPRGRLARLSPAHGWPSFWTEIAIVVLGVLIALGAQQAVDGWNAQSETAEFRQALDGEIAYNLAQYRERMKQAPCLARRLDQLDAWQRDVRDDKRSGIAGTIGRPVLYPPRNTVWPMGTNGVANRIPLKERLVYADLADTAALQMRLGQSEIDVWRELWSYEGSTAPTPAEVKRLHSLILSARALDRSIRANAVDSTEQARQVLGVGPSAEPSYALSFTGLCPPLRFTKGA